MDKTNEKLQSYPDIITIEDIMDSGPETLT